MKTSMIGSGMFVALAVAAMSIAACDRSEKVGETYTTSATPSAPAEANPVPAAAPLPDDSLAGGDSMKDAGHIAPVGAPARRATTKSGVQMGTPNNGTGPGRIYDRTLNLTPPTAPQPGSVDTAVGPGHITTPALPDDHRATGAPNNDGSHNIGR